MSTKTLVIVVAGFSFGVFVGLLKLDLVSTVALASVGGLGIGFLGSLLLPESE